MVDKEDPAAPGRELAETSVTPVDHTGPGPARRPRRRGHSAPHGQFFTLDTVARFLWHVVDRLQPAGPPPWRVVDLAAGDGILLDSGCAGGWTSPDLAAGLEIDADLVAARQAAAGAGVPAAAAPSVAAAASVAHPGGHAAAATDVIGALAPIRPGDGLFDEPTSPCDGGVDVVVGNPPFGRCRDLLSAEQRRRLETEAGPLLPIWGPRAVTSEGRLSGTAGSCRVEQLFLARAVERVRPGGVVAYIVSDGVLSNRREQAARDWLGERVQPLAVIALPSSAFRRPGLNALAHLVVLRRPAPAAAEPPPVCMIERRHAGRGRLRVILDEVLADLSRWRAGASPPGTARVAAGDLRGRRWDPGFWVGRRALTAWWPDEEATADLGDFIEFLTYGPIVTGGQPRPVVGGVASIRQGDFGETGLRLAAALRVEPGSPHDPPRSRVRRGDLLMPRSGGGALGRNRVAVFEDGGPANIGCFVDLIRLRPALNPYYLWIFLRSAQGWGQIRSLINGVGTPNISFREIRALRLPVLDPAEQAEVERGYRELVLPLHRQGAASRATQRRAEAAFAGLVRRLEARLQAG